MHIERMLGIVTYLMRHGKASAAELAERFEVSRRTILRDVDRLCLAGIPVVTAQGSGGGISICEGYRVPEGLLTEEELRAVLAGVQAMDSVSASPRAPALSDKLSSPERGDWISIDLSGGARLFETIKDAILSCRALEITYCYARGEVRRVVEPLQLVYKWGAWYLIAYCRLRRDFRLFRMGRIRGAESTGESFARRPIPENMLKPDPDEPPVELEAIYAPEVRYRLLEEQPGCLAEQLPDGRLRATLCFASEEARLRWALSFGACIEVLGPASLRRELLRQAEKILARERERDR